VDRRAVPEGAALEPHEQDVHRAGLRAASAHVRAANAVDLALHVVREAAGDHDERSEDTAKGVAGLAGDRRPAVRLEHRCASSGHTKSRCRADYLVKLRASLGVMMSFELLRQL